MNGTINVSTGEIDSIPNNIFSSSSSNSMFDDFQGISLLRTTCLECEFVTERKESFCDICVPINGSFKDDVSPDHEYNCFGTIIFVQY